MLDLDSLSKKQVFYTVVKKETGISLVLCLSSSPPLHSSAITSWFQLPFSDENALANVMVMSSFSRLMAFFSASSCWSLLEHLTLSLAFVSKILSLPWLLWVYSKSPPTSLVVPRYLTLVLLLSLSSLSSQPSTLNSTVLLPWTPSQYPSSLRLQVYLDVNGSPHHTSSPDLSSELQIHVFSCLPLPQAPETHIF